MMVEVEKDGIIGYGEASMPPYLGESQETAAAFLAKGRPLAVFPDPFQLEEVLPEIDAIAPGQSGGEGRGRHRAPRLGRKEIRAARGSASGGWIRPRPP